MLNGTFGFDDVPAAKDTLSISSYIDGLSGFIENCPTPMTIAVQGAWGTGKTSAMLQIKENLKTESTSIQTVFFNTWQYSQFDLGENLAISMLKAIADGLEKGQPEQKSGKFENLSRLIFRAGKLYASKTVPAVLDLAGMAVVSKAVSAAIETGAELRQPLDQEPDGIEILSSLRQAFEEAVRDSDRRLVIFIDDLDRLAPARAIEVMEAIKVFLDVRNCVFVLAIDFDVVKMGVKAKYGEDVSERKARSFFDKIIQVPFHMPVGRYEMRGFFESALKNAGLNDLTKKFEQYIELSAASVGTNPRSTKRLLNTFLLLKSILRAEKTNQPGDDLHLFGTLCLQTAFPEAYDALAENTRNGDPAEEFMRYKDVEDDKFGNWGVPENEIGLMDRFYEAMQRAFTVGGKFSHESFNRAFSQSTITSVSSGGVSSIRTRIHDREERRRRALEKRDANIVNLGFQFERELTSEDEAFASQSNPAEWTMRMGRDHPRIGLLTLRTNDVKVALEFKVSKNTITEVEEEAKKVEDEIKLLISRMAESAALRDLPEVRRLRQANQRYVIVEITKLKSAAQISQLVEVVKPMYELADREHAPGSVYSV